MKLALALAVLVATLGGCAIVPVGYPGGYPGPGYAGPAAVYPAPVVVVRPWYYHRRW
jgi:hypothetical protein